MTPKSFQFGSINSVDDLGVYVIYQDVFLPQKRERKIRIPLRDGMYDYGAQNFEERALTLDCLVDRKLSRGELREISYALSGKKRLTLFTEPDKYYVGELYEAPEIVDFPEQVKTQFVLRFVCEPFAYRETCAVPIADGANQVLYGGTAEAPCIIVLRNEGTEPVANITVTLTRTV